jgi:hypothetical protein
MVNRNGSPELVLVDYGLDSDVCASFTVKRGKLFTFNLVIGEVFW